MLRFLRCLNVWRWRREALEKRFAEMFGVPFPGGEEGRTAIRDHVLRMLVEIGGEVESARVEFNEKKDLVSDPNRDRGTRMLILFWTIRAAQVVEKKGKVYRELRKLARRAGFSKEDLIEAERRATEAGAKGGLIFRTGRG